MANKIKLFEDFKIGSDDFKSQNVRYSDILTSKAKNINVIKCSFIDGESEINASPLIKIHSSTSTNTSSTKKFMSKPIETSKTISHNSLNIKYNIGYTNTTIVEIDIFPYRFPNTGEIKMGVFKENMYKVKESDIRIIGDLLLKSKDYIDIDDLTIDKAIRFMIETLTIEDYCNKQIVLR